MTTQNTSSPQHVKEVYHLHNREALPHLNSAQSYADFARLAAAMNFSAAGEFGSLRYATPTTNGGGAGVSGRILNRGPARHSNPCCTSATPRPASTDAIRLVELSCSSAISGAPCSGPNKSASQAWYSG